MNTAKDFLNRVSDFDSILPIRRINMEAHRSGSSRGGIMMNIGGIRLTFKIETCDYITKIRWDMLEQVHSIEESISYFNLHLLLQGIMQRELNTIQVIPSYELDVIAKAWIVKPSKTFNNFLTIYP